MGQMRRKGGRTPHKLETFVERVAKFGYVRPDAANIKGRPKLEAAFFTKPGILIYVRAPNSNLV